MPNTFLTRSRFADQDAARHAVAMTLPGIETALRDPRVSGLGVLHLVMLDPAARFPHCSFDDAVMYEYSVGDRAMWDADYAAFARDKARLSWQYGVDSRRLQLLEPHRLSARDSLRWGGVWLDGIVVAASGALPAWDEAFALTVAGGLRAIAFNRAQAAREAGG
jgi:hypothetical protein